MTITKSHTHCLAAHATRIQSQSKSVLSAVYVDKIGFEKMPHRTSTKKDWCKLTGDRNAATNEGGEGHTATNI